MKTKRSEIGKRAFYEVQRIFETNKDAIKALGITHRQHLYNWLYGSAPGAKYLQQLYFSGADVYYILTGEKSNEIEKTTETTSEKGIGKRAYEECLRLWDSIEDATDAIEASAPVVIYRWKHLCLPDAINLSMLCKHGADIKYILTGERTQEGNNAEN